MKVYQSMYDHNANPINLFVRTSHNAYYIPARLYVTMSTAVNYSRRSIRSVLI